MKVQVGNSYRLKIPNSGFGRPVKIHIESIFTPSVDEPDVDELKLVVYRVWAKHKKYWKYYVEPYYVLCIFNEWDYTVD